MGSLKTDRRKLDCNIYKSCKWKLKCFVSNKCQCSFKRVNQFAFISQLRNFQSQIKTLREYSSIAINSKSSPFTYFLKVKNITKIKGL